MSPAAFLLIAVVVALLGSVVVVARNRQAQRPEHAMHAFRREMDALAPSSRTEGPARQRLPFRPAWPRDDAGSDAR